MARGPNAAFKSKICANFSKTLKNKGFAIKTYNEVLNLIVTLN